ncbi:MAG: hypothetical protein J0I49_18060 [Pseudonocardia sp.]|uniref:hypothetical protein n=1 Tax=Pseudonocardia sp. TaxID=60912 RepID=UPI001AC4B082|nr:hypothetical protein [Pseudonocardia sp.]MBN9099996.1 hypothetical protein [Pseudonocardia sp.]
MTSIEDSRIPADLLPDDPAPECPDPPAPVPPRISVVVPTLNESHDIGWVLARLPRDLHEVILVDGRSVDGTADVVKGSRVAVGAGSSDLPTVRRLGNQVLTFAANLVYRQSWRELCYGYAAFWVDVLPLLDVAALAEAPGQENGIGHGHGFEIEAVLFCRAARAGLRVAEVFSFEHERRSGMSHLSTWGDGVRVLRALVRERRYRSPVTAERRRRRPPAVTGPSVPVPSARIGGLA